MLTNSKNSAVYNKVGFAKTTCELFSANGLVLLHYIKTEIKDERLPLYFYVWQKALQYKMNETG